MGCFSIALLVESRVMLVGPITVEVMHHGGVRYPKSSHYHNCCVLIYAIHNFGEMSVPRSPLATLKASSPGTPKRLLIGPGCRLGRVAHVMIVAMIVLSSAPWGHRTFARQSLMCLTSLTREHIHLTMGDYIVPSPSLVVPMSQSLRIRSASFIPTKKRHVSRLKYHTLAAETKAEF